MRRRSWAWYSEKAEEEAIKKALTLRGEQDREAALEAATPVEESFDPWAFAGLGSGAGTPAPITTIEANPIPSLFDSVDGYLNAGCNSSTDT